jgi:sulfite reductase beta subunit-like hemoprotein
LDLGKKKRTRDAIGTVRIISERTLDTGEEICICFIDWQKAFENVKWTKLMEILKKTGIHWLERRLICKLYMDQSESTARPRGDKESQDWKS